MLIILVENCLDKLKKLILKLVVFLILPLFFITACQSPSQKINFIEIAIQDTLWLAYQDGNEPWQSLPLTFQEIDLHSGHYGVAWVCRFASDIVPELKIYAVYDTIQSNNIIKAQCNSGLAEKNTILGKVIGLSEGECARISFNDNYTKVRADNNNFNLSVPQNQPLDILATLNSEATDLPNKLLWLQTTANASELQIDFDTDSLPLNLYQITLPIIKDEQSLYAWVRMKAGDTHAPLSKILDDTANLEPITNLFYMGLNTDALPEGIFHEIYLRTFSKDNAFRTITRHVRNAKDINLISNLPPVLPQASFSKEQGRLLARWQLERTNFTTWDTQIVAAQLATSMNRYLYVNYTSEYLQNKNKYEVVLPQFSEIATWDSKWNFTTSNLYWFLQINQATGIYGQDDYMVTQSRRQGVLELF